MSQDVEHTVEAALVILVPEVEPLVGPFRLQHDPSAAVGVPAHVTINYPFLPGVDPPQDLYARLQDLFAPCDAFSFTFRRFARFPEVLYLAPEPDRPFRRLIEFVMHHFPESPPYGGAFDDVVPHLTVAQTEDPDILTDVERQLSPHLLEQLPRSMRADRVWLMDNRTGRWHKRTSFPLRPR
jgi:2'-5' RNA ligase